MSEQPDDIIFDDYEQEMRTIAREYFRDLWENSIADGIDPKIIAETIMEETLNEIASLKGDREPGRILSDLMARDEHGAFLATRTLQ